MRRLIALSTALVLSGLVLGMVVRAPLAQTEAPVLAACEVGREKIEAAALPGVVEPGECPAGGRQISDGAAASVVPPPGRTVYAEVLTTTGAQELEVRRRPDGAIELDHVGDESESFATGGFGRVIDEGKGCYSGGYTDLDHKVAVKLTYAFRTVTTPRSLRRFAASNAIRRAAFNVFDTRNTCRMGDRVPVALQYGGGTNIPAQVGDGLCGLNDGHSVVAFGDLRKGVLAAACTISEDQPYYDEILTADIKINRTDFRWTTTPDSRSCRRAYDVEGVMTHEWGHVFGLGHVPGNGNRYLTMSPIINGPCQSLERTLGRGDVLGLDAKYQ